MVPLVLGRPENCRVSQEGLSLTPSPYLHSLFPSGQGRIILGSHECPVGYSVKTVAAEANFLRVRAFLHVRILALMASCQGQKMRADLPHDAYLCPFYSCSLDQCSQFLSNIVG